MGPRVRLDGFQGLGEFVLESARVWPKAVQALAKVLESAVEKGVEYRANAAVRLMFGDNVSCIGP